MRRETKNCKGTTDTSTGRGGRADPAEGSTKKKKKKGKCNHATSKEKHAESTS